MLFDLDDTLFDHSLTCRAALGRLRREHAFFRRVPLDRLWREYLTALEQVHPGVLAGRWTPDEARAERFRRLGELAGRRLGTEEAAGLSRSYRTLYRTLRRPVPGARAVLERLHGRTAIGVVTNNEVAEQEEKLRFLGIADRVDALVISAAVGCSKPDPRIFAIALDRLGAGPDEAVMIGDSWTNDVEGARSASIRPIWFNRFGAPRPGGSRVTELDSFRSLPRLERALAARS